MTSQVEKNGAREVPVRTPVVVIAALLAAMVLVVLDAAIANIALPTIARSLAVTPAQSVWVVTAYQLALVMALLPCAALGESVGFRRVFIIGIALFTGASLLCALSPSLPWLVVARFVQGLGGAAVMALTVALLRAALPPHMLGAAIGWNALTIALTTAAGPTLGALILSVAPWPWLFAVNIPLGVAILAASPALPAAAGTGRRLDLASVALNIAGCGAFVFGAELLARRLSFALLLLAIAALVMAMLVRRERGQVAPLIPIDLLRSESFRMSVIASICCFSGQGAAMIALPFYLQHTLGQTAVMTGLLITPWPVAVAFMAPVAGRMADRMPTARLCAMGGVVLAIGLAAIAGWPLARVPLSFMLPIAVCGLGFGLFQVPNNRNMFLAAPRERSGAAGGMQGTARLLGQTIGAVLMTLLFTLAPADLAPRIGLALGAVLTLCAGLASVLRGGRSQNDKSC